MVGQLTGIASSFRKGFTDDPNWKKKFSLDMHQRAEQNLEMCLMNNKNFAPTLIFVRENGYLVTTVGEYVRNEETKDMLEAELVEAAQRPEIIGIIFIMDIWLRKSIDSEEKEDAIYTNAQWRDSSFDTSVITKYYKKSDVECGILSREELVHDALFGRFANFFRR